MIVRPGAPHRWRAVLVGVLALVAGACAAPPQKEMDQAEGAIATARAAGASEYAATEFAAAQTALQRSADAVAQRDYRQALNHALDARERAQTAAREAADKKAIARGRAERSVTAAELALATAQQRLGAAVAGAPAAARRPTPAIEALQAAVVDVTARLQEARSQLQAQRFDEAVALADPLVAAIQAAVTAFEDARPSPPSSRSGRRGR